MKCVDKLPNAKLAKLSLTRFSTPLSDEEMTEIYKGNRSANTQRSTAWEVKTFREWISERNSEDQVPETSLTKILQKGVLIIQILGCTISLSTLEDKMVKIIC